MAKELFKDSYCFSKQFDEATLQGDAPKLKTLVQEVEKDIEKGDVFFRLHMYYSLATAISSIGKLECKNGNNISLECLQKQLYYYRKAIALFEDEQIASRASSGEIIKLKAVIYTNYGNALGDCGRKIAAIEQYNNSLSVYPDFAMALGNMGLAYMNYARVLSNEEGYIRDCLNHYALKLLNDAIESNDPNIHAEAKVYYVGHVALFSADYREYLQKDIVLPEAPKLTKAETEYRKWCIDNGLFLNSLSDLPCKELAFAFDGLTLPPILTSLHAELPIIIGMFNQLKQEYVSARYTFYESLEFKGRPHFSDKRTSIAETLEYAQFSLRVERLKSAFKTLFGILDKTAFFLNEYYELGIKSKDVNFKTVWQSEIKSKNGYKFKNTLDDSNNFALGSLHWIQREFEKSSDQYASPQYVRLKEVRNALEHRYTIVTMLTKNPDEIKKNDVAMYICETELYNLTFDLLKIVREAIICLALCVTIKEREKKEAADSDRIMTQKIHQVDDEFKI